MATKKFIELQDFTDSELVNEIKETQAQYRKLRFDHAIKGLDNPLVLREVRRNIARLNTESRRRVIEKMSEEEKTLRSKIRLRRRK